MTVSRASRVSADALVLGLACLLASSPASAASQPAAPEPSRKLIRLASTNYFDVGTCWLKPPNISVGSDGAVTAAILTAQPKLKECLVDPRCRKADPLTRMTIEATLSPTGPQVKVTGDNLTADGIQCLKDTLTSWLKDIPAFSEKGAEGTAKVELGHNAEVDPAVTLGVNDQSDAIAVVRLAEPAWCDCFAPWNGKAPRLLQGKVSIAQIVDGGHPVAEIQFQPAGDPAADQVAACLANQISLLTFPTSATSRFELALSLRYVDSAFDGDATALPPDLQLVQLDIERSRATAVSALALSARDAAAGNYADIVKQYRAKPKKVKIAQIVDVCHQLLKADDAVEDALSKSLDVEHRTHAFASAQQAKNAAWEPARAASEKQEAAAGEFVARSKKTRVDDEAACPKVH